MKATKHLLQRQQKHLYVEVPSHNPLHHPPPPPPQAKCRRPKTNTKKQQQTAVNKYEFAS